MLKEYDERLDWIGRAEAGDSWRAVVHMVMKLQFV